MPLIIISSERDHTQSADLAGAMRLAGRDVTLDARGDLPLGALSDLGHELADRWRSAPPDAVMAHGWQAGLAAQIALQDGAVPVVQRFCALAARASDPKRARLESALARGADRVVASHAGQVEQLVALGVRRPNIRVVPYGVDVNAFNDNGPASPRSQRRRIVAAMTSLDPAFLGFLVNTLPSLPDAELVILGLESSQQAGATLVQQAARHGVADRLLLVAPRAREERAALLRSCDVAISTGADDSAAAFVLQAMACGVPVISRAVGSAADAVADGVTGVLVPPGGAEHLTDAVRSLLSDDVRRESFGLAAVDRARARFNWTVAAGATGRIVDEVTGAARVVTLPRQDSLLPTAVASRG